MRPDFDFECITKDENINVGSIGHEFALSCGKCNMQNRVFERKRNCKYQVWYIRVSLSRSGS